MEFPENIKYIPGFIVYIGICLFLYGIPGIIFFCKIVEPIINFFKKRKAPKEPIQPPAPLPCEQCKELEVECNLLRDEIKRAQAEHDKETFNLCQKIDELKTRLEDYDGEFIKEQFDNIILSFIKSKPLSPNISIENLTNLCSVSEANDRFFRALLHDFEIQSLTVTNKDGKHNITMKIKSGENTYNTSLIKCDCPDFRNRRQPKVCKHMYFLVLSLGLISFEHYDNFYKYSLASPNEEKIKSLKKK
ncbi:MAG: hypothetical protein E7473_06350 [Ruminococcaceae bacterium]|nr:hypothetical protein [Oscillospiraceae bacterium]